MAEIRVLPVGITCVVSKDEQSELEHVMHHALSWRDLYTRSSLYTSPDTTSPLPGHNVRTFTSAQGPMFQLALPVFSCHCPRFSFKVTTLFAVVFRGEEVKLYLT